MGFRELQKFNDAFLAKQVWRLIHNQSSLLYKVFKAKFFPHSSIMEARYSKHASFSWKSILQAHDVIRRGAHWQVGNGRSIWIWGDRMLLVENQVETPSCSDQGRWKSLWAQVWSVMVPLKVRHFLWRVCSNALPTMANLFRSGITVTGRCSFCQVDNETALHALWSCPSLDLVWATHRLARKVFGRHPSTMIDVISYLFEVRSASTTAQVLIMLWLIWTRRNKALYQHILNPLDDIHSLALHLYDAYYATNVQDTGPSPRQA